MTISLSAGWQSHAAKFGKQIATLIRLTPVNTGVFPELGLTTHDGDITIDDGAGTLTFKAMGSVSLSDFQSGLGLEVANVEATGPFVSAGVTAADLRDGAYDQGTWRMSEVITSDLAAGVRPRGFGPIGKTTLGDYGYVLELTGPQAWLEGSVVTGLGPGCELAFGDDDVPRPSRTPPHTAVSQTLCGFRLDPPAWTASTAYTVRPARDAKKGSVVKPTGTNPTVFHFKCVVAGTSGSGEPDWTQAAAAGDQITDGGVTWEAYLAGFVEATVTAVTDRSNFTVDVSTGTADHFRHGRIEWGAGAANAGLEHTGHGWIDGDDGAGAIRLWVPAPRSISVGETLTIFAGCQKRLKEDCDQRFDNVDNFFGATPTPGSSAVKRLRTNVGGGGGGGSSLLPGLFTLAGAAIGFVVGGVWGLRIGLLAGGILGSVFFGGGETRRPGIDDRSVSTADLGVPLTVLFGTDVLGGHAMWVKDGELQQVIVEHEEGGLFGTSLFATEIEEPRLKLNALVVFTDTRMTGPAAGVIRLYEDADLIFEVDQDKLDAALAAGDPLPAVQQFEADGAEFEILLGTDDQQVDSEIDDDMQARGLGPAPAFRWMTGMRIKNRDVTRFGRMPDYRAEVVGVGTDAFTWQAWPVPSTFDQSNFANYSRHAAHPAGGDTWAWQDNVTEAIAIMDLRRHSVRVQRDHSVEGDTFDPGEGDVNVRPATNAAMAMDDLGRVYVAQGSVGIWRLDPQTLLAEALAAGPSALSTGTVDMSIGSGTDKRWMRVNTWTFPPPVGTLRLLVAHSSGTVYIIDADTMIKLGQFDLVGAGGEDFNQRITFDLEPVVDGDPNLFDFWAHGRSSFTGAGTLAHWRITRGTTWTAVEQSKQSASGGKRTVTYVPTEDVVYDGGAGGAGIVFDRSLTAVTSTGSGAGWRGQSAAVRPTGSTMWVFDDQFPIHVHRIRLPDLTTVEDLNLSQWSSTAGWHSVPGTESARGLVDPLFRSVTVHVDNGVARYWLPRPNPQEVERSWIYQTLSEIPGVPAARIDVSAITGTTWGYALRRDISAADGMRELNLFYGEDATMAGFDLKFFPLSVTPSVTLERKDLGAEDGDSRSDELREERLPGFQVPRQLEVVFPDRTAPLYETNLARSPIIPKLVPGLTTTQRREVPIPLTPTEAAQQADVLHRRMIEEGGPIRASITRRYPELHPGDVIRVPRDPHAVGLLVDMRITSITEGARVELEGLRAASAFTSTAVGIAGGMPAAALKELARTRLVMMDAPMLPAANRDDDTVAARVAAGPKTAGTWPGAEIQRSADGGETFNAWNFITSEALIGFAENALADGDSHVPDDANTLTVQWLGDHGLATVSEASLFTDDGGGNFFAVFNETAQDWELLKARDVSDLGSRRTTLSYLIRGRQGTEHRTAGHVAGETVVRLDTAKLLLADTGVALDDALIFAAITLGLTTLESELVDFTNTGRTLRPFSVGEVAGSRDGSDNLTISWDPRSRFGKGLDDGSITTVPDDDDYEVDVLDSAGSVVRTLTASGAQQVTYSAADQTTDFGATVDAFRHPLILTNPSAETGDLTGWTVVDGGWQALQASSALGEWNFDPTDRGTNQLRQNIAIPTERESDVDTGTVKIEASYWVWNNDGDFDDTARLHLNFKDAADASLGTATDGLHTTESQSTWEQRTFEATVPANTRSIDVTQDSRAAAPLSFPRIRFDAVGLVLVGGVQVKIYHLADTAYNAADSGRGTVAEATV